MVRSHFFRVVLCAGIVIPISFFSVGGADIPVAVFFLVIGWMLVLCNVVRLNRSLLFVFLGLVIGFVGILLQVLFGNNVVGYHPFLSFVFFALPLGGYFLGRYYLMNESAVTEYLRNGAWVSSFFSIALGGSIAVLGGSVKIYIVSNAGQLAYFNPGMFDGFLYASKGVNSLSAVLSFLFLMVLSVLLFEKQALLSKVVNLLGAFFLLYLITSSDSRGALLGVFLGGGIIVYLRLNKVTNPIDRFAYKVVFYVSIFASIVLLSVFDERIGKTIELLFSGEYLRASTNRILIIGEVLSDLFHNPVFGASFGATGDYLPSGNSSAHNQLLTILWKIGPLGGLFYVIGILGLISKVLKSLSQGSSFMLKAYFSGMIALVFVESLFWDVLMIPIIGGVFFMLLGALANHKKHS